VIPTSEFESDSVLLEIDVTDSFTADTTMTFYSLLPGKDQQFSFFNNGYVLNSNPATVYDTLLFQANVIQIDSQSFSTPISGSILQLKGQPQIFKNSMLLKIKCDSLPGLARQVGLSRVNGNGDLSWRATKWDSISQTVSSRISGFGNYILCADTVAPIVEIQNPVNESVINQLKEIKFFMDDSLSGIQSDRNIQVFLDGKFVIPEWDPERNIVVAKPNGKLVPGKHYIEVRVRDAAGNEAWHEVDFLIE